MDYVIQTTNVVTRGDNRIGVDMYQLGHPHIQKVWPNAPKFDPMQKKQSFKDVVEMFCNIYVPMNPTIVER
jgi:hypothetical protein